MRFELRPRLPAGWINVCAPFHHFFSRKSAFRRAEPWWCATIIRSLANGTLNLRGVLDPGALRLAEKLALKAGYSVSADLSTAL
jgi:hypothetical protein